ncbi:MAG: iron-containing alcohol dehydrogenase [Pseudolabrys sp.]|nr:iron-containing alcohol dehydrogenase [Pseudolabrys sp.]
MTLKANWNYPTAIKFGAGRIAELAEVCKGAGIQRPLLVTDGDLAKLPMVTDALARLKSAALGVALYSKVTANPVAANVTDGVKAYRDGNHDGVIAFGGGSALDAGKTVAFMSGQSRPLWDFEDVGDNYLRADVKSIAPSIAVPTTAGTGSEVGRVSVITDNETHTKRLIFHPRIMPVAVVADPELTVGMSPKTTAATGMDALAHCIEAYCAPGFHPMADGIALEGTRLIKEWLPVAFRDGSNIEARANMMAAATMGAAAFQKGLGAVHSLSHPLGAIYGTHHGLLNGVLLPYVLAFNRKAIEAKMARLSAYLGLGASGFDGVMKWLLDLRRSTGIPETLKAVGIDDSKVATIARAALKDPTAPTNPVELSEASLATLLRQSI